MASCIWPEKKLIRALFLLIDRVWGLAMAMGREWKTRFCLPMAVVRGEIGRRRHFWRPRKSAKEKSRSRNRDIMMGRKKCNNNYKDPLITNK